MTQSFRSACARPMSLTASMIMSASASDAPVSTRMTRSAASRRKDLTTPLFFTATRHGTILMPSIARSFRMLTTGRSLFKILRRLANRRDDVAVAGAAAEISRDRFFDLRVARAALLAQQAVGRHEHPRRAIAALDRVLFPERFLQRMEPLVARQ